MKDRIRTLSETITHWNRRIAELEGIYSAVNEKAEAAQRRLHHADRSINLLNKWEVDFSQRETACPTLRETKSKEKHDFHKHIRNEEGKLRTCDEQLQARYEDNQDGLNATQEQLAVMKKERVEINILIQKNKEIKTNNERQASEVRDEIGTARQLLAVEKAQHTQYVEQRANELRSQSTPLDQRQHILMEEVEGLKVTRETTRADRYAVKAEEQKSRLHFDRLVNIEQTLHRVTNMISYDEMPADVDAFQEDLGEFERLVRHRYVAWKDGLREWNVRIHQHQLQMTVGGKPKSQHEPDKACVGETPVGGAADVDQGK